MKGRLAAAVFYVAFALFLAAYVRDVDFQRLAGIRLDFRWLAAATTFALLFRGCGVVIWLRALEDLGATGLNGKAELVHAYAKSWMARYLPGKITWILGRIYFGSEQGIAARTLAIGSVFEAGLQVLVTLVLSLLLLSADSRLDVIGPALRLTLMLVVCALLVLLAPGVFNRLVEAVSSRTGKHPVDRQHRIDRRTLWRVARLQAFGFFLSGAGYFCLTRAVDGRLGSDDFLFVSAAFNLAGAVGMLSLFAPSGLGVREGVQLLLLRLVMPAEIALVVTMAARLWSLAVDVIYLGATWLHAAVRRHADGHRSVEPSHELS